MSRNLEPLIQECICQEGGGGGAIIHFMQKKKIKLRGWGIQVKIVLFS